MHKGVQGVFAAAARPRHAGAYTDAELATLDETARALQAIAKAVTSKDEAAAHDKGTGFVHRLPAWWLVSS